MSTTELKDFWGRVIGIPFVAFFLLMFSEDLTENYSLLYKVIASIRILVYVFAYWYVIRFIFLTMRKKFPNLRETPRRIIIQVVVVLIVTGMLSILITLLSNVSHDYIKGESFLDRFIGVNKKSLSISAIVMMGYECFYFFGQWKNSMLESERLKKEQVLSQYELLKHQVSPHFLFNSLNTLITLVPEDPVIAVEFIQRLSNVYRHVLQQKDENTVNLEDEISFLRDYVFLNQMRFGKSLSVEIELPATLNEMQIVPFTLQMLVENAIKHNVVSARLPLSISITTEDHFIVVKNNLQKKSSGVESTQIGLQNIKNRYNILTNNMVEVIVTPTDFCVFIPLIQD